MATCVNCGGPLPPPGKAGPPRRYCSGRCREAARRRRVNVLKAEIVPRRDRAHAEPSPRAHPDQQVAVAVLEATRVSGAFLRLASEARPQLSWRCEKVGAGLRSLLADNFGDLA